MNEFLATLTGFDYLVIVILAVSVLIGFSRGFVTEILALGAWAGAIAITIFGFVPATDLAREFITPKPVADIITGLVLFFGSLIILKLGARAIGDMARQSSIGALDRSMGAVFGLARGIIVLAGFYLLFSSILPLKRQPDWIIDARFQPAVYYGSEMLATISKDLLARVEAEEETQEILDQMRARMPTPTDFSNSDSEEGAYAQELRDKLQEKVQEVMEEDDIQKKDDEENSPPPRR